MKKVPESLLCQSNTQSEQLTEVVLGLGISEICDCAFFGNEKLETVSLPEGLKTIGDMAFYGCTSLSSLTFPSSLESIGDGAFLGCNLDLQNGVSEDFQGNYSSAFRYTDTKENGFANVHKGSHVKWGYKEQDNNTYNGEEELTWIVLDHDEDKGSWLMISEKVIDISQYSSAYTDYSYDHATWKVIRTANLSEEEYSSFIQNSVSCNSIPTAFAKDQKEKYDDTYEAYDGSTRWYYKDLNNWWGSDYFYFYKGGYGSVRYAWAYTVFGCRPVVEITPISSFNISQAGLYEKKEQLNTQVDALKYAAGNFYYDKAIDIENPDTTDYDELYLSFLATYSNRKELVTTQNVEIQLPAGLSFEPDKMVSKKSFEIRFSQSNNERIWEKIYLLYSEEYVSSSTQMKGNFKTVVDNKEIADDFLLIDLEVEGQGSKIYFSDTDESGNRYEMAYDKSLFDCNSSEYNQRMALYSAYLANIIESGDKQHLKLRIEKDLLSMGFSHIQYSGYSDALIKSGKMEEYVCATKKIINNKGNIQTIVAYAIQGTDAIGSGSPNTIPDWFGNIGLGIQADVLNKYHDNFTTCINNNYNSFNRYLTTQGISINGQDVKVIVTGHSRGGAIANGVSAKLDDTSIRGRLYSYTFAAPNHLSANTALNSNYNYMFNVINKYDAVPYVPTNFYKYGKTLVIHEGNANSIVSNHGMDRYIKGVKKGEFDGTWADTLEEMKKTSTFCDLLNSISPGVVHKRAYQKIRSAPNRIVNLFHCPVNIEILNSSGESVCAIVDDNIFYDFDNKVFLMIRDDEKVVSYPSGEGYSVRAIGDGNGVMSYTCISVDENGEDSEVQVFNELSVSTNQITIATKDNGSTLSFINGSNTPIVPDTIYDGKERAVNVTLNSNIEGADLLGSGKYTIGERVFVSCDETVSGKSFSGWYDEEGNCISTSEEYDFLVDKNIKLTARYGKESSLISITNTTVKVSSQVYSGKALTPTPVILSVDGTNLVKGVDYDIYYSDNTNVGTATLIIIGKGNYTGTTIATFKINKATQSITASNLSLTYLKTGTVKASGNKGKLTYKSSNTAIVAIDSAGKVTTKGAGTAKITITAAATSNYKAATKTITVTVAKASQSITAKSSASSIPVGKTATVSITGNKGTKSFKSSDTTIATVTSAGKVTAKKVGTVKITAASAAVANFNAASKTVTIKIVPSATASITAANQATGIKLTWKKVTGATGYLVYRGNTKIATIKSGSTVTYTDKEANTNGTKYTFKIVPTASTGNGTAKTLVTYCVARPAVSSATNSAAGKMTVKWGKDAKATGYQIQYCPDKTFKTGNKSVSINSASTVSKVIGNLAKGKTYYVRIRTFKTR